MKAVAGAGGAEPAGRGGGEPCGLAPQRERGAVLLPRVGTHTHAHTLPPAPPLREPDAEVHFKTGVDTQRQSSRPFSKTRTFLGGSPICQSEQGLAPEVPLAG